VQATRRQILDAAASVLRGSGHGGLTMRQIADEAGVGLGHIHYHFGSRRKLVLEVLADQNAQRLARQQDMYGDDMPLWKQWEQACDYLEDDLTSGYVRILQEMIAAGWVDAEIAQHVRGLLRGWFALLVGVAERAEAQLGNLGPFTAAEVATLVGDAFIGAEALILLGLDGGDGVDHRAALRRVGDLLRQQETTG
jgi:AcrR family transcriptional regulator